jgi:hypothetical protein
MNNSNTPNKIDKNKTIEMITLHGFNKQELYDKFMENKISEDKNELYPYITSEGTSYHDTSGVSDIMIFCFGLTLSILIYFIYTKILVNITKLNFMKKK